MAKWPKSTMEIPTVLKILKQTIAERRRRRQWKKIMRLLARG